MAKQKFDGVIEAVHYQTDGQVDWVRAYLRRGPVFSDLVIIDRQTLIDLLRSGKRFVVGERVAYMGAQFEVSHPLRLVQKDGKAILVVGDRDAESDCLNGVPQL